MFHKIFVPSILIVLSYGFWISPDFKEISAGVAIFLFGMFFLEEGFKAFSGGLLEKILQKSTDKIHKSLMFGIVSTTIMQSSSLVSILSISFLSAGFISLNSAIGIIFGANLGTTTGAWLVAGLGLKINIAAYAMPMLVFGIVLIFQKSNVLKGIGYVLSGLGFLFLGIHHMKVGFEAFKESIDLAQYAIDGFLGLFIFLAIGVAATVVMQSSHATLILIITALAAHQISYENALALAIGANVGTTITAIIGSISSNIDGKRLAVAHLIFNLLTGIIAIVFIGQFIWAVDEVSVIFGIDAENYTMKLAIFHTIFNLVGVLICVPYITKLAEFLNKYIKTKQSPDGQERAMYLNASVLKTPDTAKAAIRQETLRLYENSVFVIKKGLDSRKNKTSNIDSLYVSKIKGIYSDIIDFSTQSQSTMSVEQIQKLYRIKIACRDIVEAVKDTKHLQKNLVKYISSSNEYIKKEYQLFYDRIFETLSDIEKLKLIEDESEFLIQMSKTKLSIGQSDIVTNGTLDKLIRDNLINSEMATSLMNDSTYTHDIRTNLLAMAEIIIFNSNKDESSANEDIILDSKELKNIIKEK